MLAANIDEAAAAQAQAQADLQTARLNLGYAEICSPISGYIGNRAAQVGAYVSQGTYLLTIVPAHGLLVDANRTCPNFGRWGRRPRHLQRADIVAKAFCTADQKFSGP